MSVVAPINYLSRPSTASPASHRSQALKSNIPAPSGVAPAAATIRTLGARLALKQSMQQNADIPAPSSGVPRPLLSPSLRRILYTTASIRSTSTSTFAPPPPGLPSLQRARQTLARVGAYLPRRALPTVSVSLLPTVMMETESELTEIGTKQVGIDGTRSQSLGQRVFEYFKARSLSMARKQLPPKFISVVYAVHGIVSAILLYFGLIYGIRFTNVMEGVWAFAFVIAILQEFFIHQLVIAAVRTAAVILLQPLRSDNHEEQGEGHMSQSHTNYRPSLGSASMQRIQKMKIQSKPRTDK
jgi:hypothetical protein